MDINGNLRLVAGEFRNLYTEKLASDPSFSAGEEGRVYFNTTSDVLRLNNGSAWVDLAVGTPSLGALTDVTLTGVATNDFLYYNGSAWVNVVAGTTRTALGLGTFATENLAAVPAMTLAGNISAANTYTITNLITPVNASDAATKGYVDQLASGLRDFKDSVRVATTAHIASLSTLLTVDGVTLVAGNRVLVKNQNDAEDNGIYLAATGAWTRAPDFDSDLDVTSGSFVFVEEGSTNDNTGWVLATNNPITLDVTELNFTKFSDTDTIYTAGDGITINSFEISIAAGDVTNAMLQNSTFTLNDVVQSLGGTVTFTSTDTSVTITTNNTTKEIDLSVNVTSDLNDLSDVTITTPSTGHTLRYNGSGWVNAFLGINDLSDVTITSAATHQVLAWNGSGWVNTKLTHLYTAGGANTSHVVTHNLNSTRPAVVVYAQSTGEVMIPQAITIDSANQLTVTLAASATIDVAVVKVA